MTVRNLMFSALLLGLAGCGCNEDSTPPLPRNPVRVPAQVLVKALAPAIPVAPPAAQAIRIDVTILMDDSDSMNNTHLGLIPANAPDDKRERAQAAQNIASSLEEKIRARLAAEYAAENKPLPALDFAYAVARYEDFGGPFTDLNRRDGPVDLPDNTENDQDARPFIVNMPILRQDLPDFDTRFQAALSREAPGDGNPRYVDPRNGNKFQVLDPQSGIEALYQLAAPQNPDGTYGGFDGNDNQSTLDSGAPTSQDPLRNPQQLPGDSGDVPSIGFSLIATPDPDGQPQYEVTDELGNVVMIPNPAVGGPATVPSVSSGNIGGIGWRENSARFVILFTDIATVAPTDAPLTGTPELPSLLPPPLQTDTVTSTDGNVPPPDAPRQASTVLLGSFDGGAQFLPGGALLTQRRIGEANGPVHDGGNGVAPIGAHTVQATIDRLNALDIEVLTLGTPFQGGLDTKPGDTGVNGDIDADISAVLYDPSDPNTVQPDMAPWFWLNAVTRLTMPEVTSIRFSGGEALFRAVYNLGTVWPFNALDPEGTDPALSPVKNTVTDDVVERVRNWVDDDFLQGSSSTGPRPPLPTVFYKFVLNMEGPGGNSDIFQAAPTVDGTVDGTPQTTFEQVVQIPTHWSDEPAPPAVEIVFPPATQNVFQYDSLVDLDLLPVSGVVPFTMLANLDKIEDQSTENAAQVAQILDFIVRRGNGTDFLPGGQPVPLTTPNDVITQAKADFTATVRSSLTAASRQIQLNAVTVGCAILNDLSFGQDGSDQQGGECPFPPPPPSTP